jgi:hypothetical protein
MKSRQKLNAKAIFMAQLKAKKFSLYAHRNLKDLSVPRSWEKDKAWRSFFR